MGILVMDIAVSAAVAGELEEAIGRDHRWQMAFSQGLRDVSVLVDPNGQASPSIQSHWDDVDALERFRDEVGQTPVIGQDVTLAASPRVLLSPGIANERYEK